MEAILACHPARSTEWLDCHQNRVNYNYDVFAQAPFDLTTWGTNHAGVLFRPGKSLVENKSRKGMFSTRQLLFTFSSSRCEKEISLNAGWRHFTSCYWILNGSHFDLPLSSINIITWLDGNFVQTWQSRRLQSPGAAHKSKLQIYLHRRALWQERVLLKSSVFFF